MQATTHTRPYLSIFHLHHFTYQRRRLPMLSLQTILPDTLELLKTLMQQPLLNQMRLVGGTSLALQYGHRQSIDLDFFGTTTEDVEELAEMMHQCAHQVVRGNISRKIKTFFLNNIKVDLVNYDYPWIDEAVMENGLRLASPKDIAVKSLCHNTDIPFK